MAVAVVVLAFVWWLMPGGNGSTPAAASPGKGRATTGSHQAPTTIGHPTPPASTGGSAHHRGGKTPSHVSLPPSHSTGRSARTRPTGPCDAAKVKLAVAVKSAHEGAGTKVRLAMSTTDGSTCSLGITPKVLELRITSGPATIWQSTSCPDGLAAKSVVVRPTPASVYSYQWDGRVSPDACSAGGRVAQPGGYWVEAALIGGEPHKAYFEVTPHR